MSLVRAEPLFRVQSKTVEWLWEPYLPRGKLCLLDGDPGVGKSLLTIDLAARLSRGAPLPTGHCQPGGHPGRRHGPVVSSLHPRDRATLWLQAELGGGRRGLDVRCRDPGEHPAASKGGTRCGRRAGGREGPRNGRYWYDPAALWPENAPFGRHSERDSELPPLTALDVNPFDAVVCRLRRRKAAETSQVVPT